MFKKFLNSLKNDNNASLIEAIQKGYKACFEASVEYSATDPITGLKKTYFGLSADKIPLETSNPEEARRQILEEWQKINNPSDRELEFLIAHKPKATVNNEYSILLTTDNSVWNQLRKLAENVYPDRIKQIKDRMYKQGQNTLRNLKAGDQTKTKEEQLHSRCSAKIEPTNVFKIQEKLQKNKLKELDRGFQEHLKRELSIMN